jgi:hypothetical protein
MILEEESVSICPSMEEMQDVYNKMVAVILNVSKHVPTWGTRSTFNFDKIIEEQEIKISERRKQLEKEELQDAAIRGETRLTFCI